MAKNIDEYRMVGAKTGHDGSELWIQCSANLQYIATIE